MGKFARFPKVGDEVVYHDPKGTPHKALLTAVWGQEETCGSIPCCNVVFVSSDPERQDNYGRQLERETSVVHKTHSSAHGNYWRFENEEPNPYQQGQT